MSKPTIPQGTRDFSARQIIRRQYIMGQLRHLFETFGFEPLETPSMEQLTTLMGKYGPEGDRLVFKILNNGIHEKKPELKRKLEQEWDRMLSAPYSSPLITERALRYDLTIPFARYVAMNQNEIAFPYRRYQIQPVWRADRPQRGRYREFWQCDVDMVGSESLINEAELLAIYQWAFDGLGIPQIRIRINSRKILWAMAQRAGMGDRMNEMTGALDKWDKIGWEGVKAELSQKGMSEEQIQELKSQVEEEGPSLERLQRLESTLGLDPLGLSGLEDLRQIILGFDQLKKDSDRVELVLDLSLARGLDYYTGMIVEVNTLAAPMGSLGGGGRYDQLTGIFGGKDIPGVGISFGLERIYDLMEEMDLFPAHLSYGPLALVLNTGLENKDYCLQMLQALRRRGIACFYFPDPVKFDKQMKFAHRKGIPFVLIAGEREREEGKFSLKDLSSGRQDLLSDQQVVETLLGVAPGE